MFVEEREKREKRSVSGGHCHVIARESPHTHTHTTGGATSSSRLPTVLLRGPSCERRTKLFALTTSPAAKECLSLSFPLKTNKRNKSKCITIEDEMEETLLGVFDTHTHTSPFLLRQLILAAAPTNKLQKEEEEEECRLRIHHVVARVSD